MPELVRTDAYLLRSVAVRERDLILTFFTEARGKITAAARGGRGSQKRFAGALEPLQRVAVELDHAERDIATLAGASVTRVFPLLTERLERLEAAGRALRWVRHVTPPREPEPVLFEALGGLFEALERTMDRGELELFRFGLTLLEAIGVGLEFARCGSCGRPRPEGKAAHVDVARGGVVCSGCGGARRVYDGAVLDGFARAREGATVGDDVAIAGLDLVESALAVHTAFDEKRGA